MSKLSLVVLLICTSSVFAVNVFNSEASFQAELATPYYFEKFDYLGWGSVNSPTKDFGPVAGFGYTMSSNQGVFSSIGYMMTNWQYEGNSLVIDFTGSPVTAVGADFFQTNWDSLHESVDVTVVLEDDTSVYFGNTIHFIGFTSEIPITQIIVGDENNSCLWPSVDDLYVGAIVPEPGCLALILIGGSLAVLRRR